MACIINATIDKLQSESLERISEYTLFICSITTEDPIESEPGDEIDYSNVESVTAPELTISGNTTVDFSNTEVITIQKIESSNSTINIDNVQEIIVDELILTDGTILQNTGGVTFKINKEFILNGSSLEGEDDEVLTIDTSDSDIIVVFTSINTAIATSTMENVTFTEKVNAIRIKDLGGNTNINFRLV